MKPTIFISLLFFVIILSFALISCEKESDDDTIASIKDTMVVNKVTYNQNNLKVPLWQEEYIYNSDNTLSKRLESRYTENGNFQPSTYDTFSYFSDKSLHTSQSFYISGENWNISVSRTVSYPNDSTREILVTYSGYELLTLEKYIYQNSLLKKYYSYTGNELYNYHEYIYDDHLLKEVRYYNGNYFYQGKDVYVYPNSSKDKIICSSYDLNDSLLNYTISEYSMGKLISVQAVIPNYNIDQEIRKIEYDPIGRIVKDINTPIQLPYMSALVIPTITFYNYAKNLYYD